MIDIILSIEVVKFNSFLFSSAVVRCCVVNANWGEP